MNFLIKTFGCQMNVNDSEKMRHILQKRGFQATHSEDEADIVIINSCAVREKAQDKIFSYIGRLAKDKRIIVAGCVAQSERENILKSNARVDFVVGTHKYYRIDGIVTEILETKKRGIQADFSRRWQEITPESDYRHSRVSGYISIMEGCNNFCSYCIVPFTRGREKYRPFESIIREAEYLAAEGYREIILLGQNVNNWEDAARGKKFTDLLAHLAQHIDVRWIRFITSYPGYYDDDLIEVMGKYRRIARHIHFPAQSGSSRVLKRMNRTYSRAQYLKIIENFKRRLPGIQFSSDFIVGFPGETVHDFALTLSLIKRVEYESVFSFIYSTRKHTKAMSIPDNLSLEQKKQRLYRLQELQEEIQRRNNRRLIGGAVEVLVTARNPKVETEVIGRTESYRVVNFESAAAAGEFRNVFIESVGPYSLRGREIE